jgi:hypothetical protein
MTSPPIDPATPLRPPDWLSGLQDAATCARYDSSVPHPARVYAYWDCGSNGVSGPITLSLGGLAGEVP